MQGKVVLWTLGVLLLIGIGAFFLYSGGETSGNEAAPGEETGSGEKVEELSEDKFENTENEEDLNPFGDEHQTSEVPEQVVQDYIHQMSHQKVEAEKKWGFYRISPERIDWLMQAVETNDYTHGNTYADILSSWNEGDFSQADKQHNTIWRMQGGNVGKATGVLSAEEEQNYIESSQ
ncbi:DUF6241 domain-containing protein [Salimicrobium sp. PL1-032A]|uniref:DUF6241 domain-containing protein n=1 Tax=Salimicrobium sp. PL1-032A TaxID=3095364 RepID=UPI00325FFB03